jgi:membrane fusion protein, multidrug efflux system
MLTNEPIVKPAPPATAAPQPKSSVGLIIVLVLAALCFGGIVWLVKFRQAQHTATTNFRNHGDLATPVIPATVARKDIPIYLDGLGTVQAYNTVTIKSRVDGQLIKVTFSEGQDVHTGDLLAQIDPMPYKTALEQAQAKKQQDAAQLANARLDLKRDADLLKDKIVTDQAMATQQAMVDGLAASVAADQAGIDSAKVQLDYATILSPLDGRCGIRQVDQGNIIHATDTNGLVVITQLRPIFVVFTLPEQYATKLAKKLSQGPLMVLALDRDNKTVLGTGKVVVIDNEIDPTTGTIKLKAAFPNEDLSLWPGQFANARVLMETRENGLVVPASVIQRGPDNEFAFVINDDMTVKIQNVKVAQIEDGMALIDEGLTEGQRVVADGQYKLQAGSKVKTDKPGTGGGEGRKGVKKPDSPSP